jgi:hypothetical protein
MTTATRAPCIFRVRWLETWHNAAPLPPRRRTRERVYTDETTAARQIDNVTRGGNAAVTTELLSVERAERHRFASIDPDTLRRSDPEETDE